MAHTPMDTDLNHIVENTRALLAELNSKYRTQPQIRELLSRIWGQEVDPSVRLFPPFYTAFGQRTRVGREVFINFSCTFLDQGGITLEDGVYIGPGVKVVTESHPEPPALRHTLQVRSILIHRNVWIGAGAIILPGVTIGENAIIAAGAVVSHDIPADVVAAGVPAQVLRPIRQ